MGRVPTWTRGYLSVYPRSLGHLTLGQQLPLLLLLPHHHLHHCRFPPHAPVHSFCGFFRLLSFFAFRCRVAIARLATVMAGSFSSGAGRSVRTSFFGWSPYLNIGVKRSGVRLKKRHEERKLMKTMYPGSSHIGGCPDTGYTKSRIALACLIVPRRLHRLLYVLRHFGGGECSLDEHRPIE